MAGKGKPMRHEYGQMSVIRLLDFMYENEDGNLWAKWTYCRDENTDHKVGIYCNLIGPLDQS